MFGRDTQGRDVAGSVRFDEANDEPDHRAVSRDRAIGDRFGRGQQILEGLAAVSLAVHEAALIEPPALVEL